VTRRRVVVTGGAGFIGSSVVSALAGGGDDVVVLDSLRPDVHRDGGSADRRRLHVAELVVGDVRDPEVLDRVLEGADAVVHLAAKVGLGVDVDDMDDYVSSNDLGTAVLLRAAAQARVLRVVQASSMVVYGEGRYTCATHGVVPPGARTAEALQRLKFEPPCPVCGGALSPGLVGEDAPLDPRNTYAATKVAQEHLASSWARETGSAAVSLRLHNVYGPGLPRDTPYAGVAARFVSSLDRGEPPRVFEDGRQRRDFVHVDDVARAFVAALDTAGAAGHHAYNVGSGTVTTIGGMARALADARGGPDPVVTGEYRLGDVRHITASSDRARDRLRWSARVSLTEGVRDLVGV
jgi:dTDP-L-rhamnose 4-epimerase